MTAATTMHQVAVQKLSSISDLAGLDPGMLVATSAGIAYFNGPKGGNYSLISVSEDRYAEEIICDPDISQVCRNVVVLGEPYQQNIVRGGSLVNAVQIAEEVGLI